jgi:hypothetical protein
MKTIWNIIAFMAVVNLLAVAGFVGWLASSDRLSRERVQAVRELLAETLTEEKARVSAEELAAKKAEEADAAAEKAGRPPLTSIEKLNLRLENTDMDAQRSRELRSQIAALRSGLMEQQSKIDEARKDVERREKLLAAQKKQYEAETTSAQFKKALTTIEGLDAKVARGVIQQIINGTPADQAAALAAAGGKAAAGAKAAPAGAAAAQTDVGMRSALAILNAMKDAKRVEVMADFAKSEPALAADLLIRLRNLGMAEVPEERSP